MKAQPAPKFGARSDQDPAWCARCGDYGGLTALALSLSSASTASGNITISRVLTIGLQSCSFEAIHGVYGFRAEAPPNASIAMAVGAKLAKPGLEVIVVSGETAGVYGSISQIDDACARNVNITHLIFSNGMASSSANATLQMGSSSQMTEGARRPLAETLLRLGAPFVASGLAADIPGSAALITKALRFPGYAAVLLHAACPTFAPEVDDSVIRGAARPVPNDHESSNLDSALRLASKPGVVWSGVVFERAEFAKTAAPARRSE
ncbi:MAG: thiamine pyrophosphate-dependent enzyme [Planctomycetota bacterium]